MDILPFLSKLSKAFQSESIDFSKIQLVVNNICETFVDRLCFFWVESDKYKVIYKQPVSESVKSVSTEDIALNLDGFEGNFDDSSHSVNEGENGVEVKYYTQQQDILTTLMPNYVNKIVENLENCFQDSEIIERVKVVLPSHISMAQKNDLAKFGVSEIVELAEHFKDQAINKDEIETEYRQYKKLVLASYRTDSLEQMCGTVNVKYNDVMPNMAKVLKCFLVIPVSSVPCERGFSTQNRINKVHNHNGK